MAAYTTIALVRAATGMTDNTKILDATVTAKILYATSAIDSYVGDVYVLPLNPVPDLIKFLALELASAMLYIDEYGEETQNLDKGWKKKMDEVFAMLEEIESQDMKLRDPTTGAELPRTDHFLPVGYPTDVSSDPAAEDSTEPKITINGLD